MRKHLFLMASLALGMAACTDADLKNEQGREPEGKPEEVKSNLTTVNLATFGADQSRVKYEGGTRAEEEELKPGDLKLVATIDNPHPSVVFKNSTTGDSRIMSATSVFRNTDGKYYVTYHVQGNNYNTELDQSIGGAIQVFEIEDGKVKLEEGFRAADPNKEDYDFNHIYFDNRGGRIIVVGHNWSVPSSYQGDLPYTGENTRAIIGVFDPVKRTLTYDKVTSSIEVRDNDGKLIDHEDAGDVNCVVRIYDQYYLATRKGIAVLNAKDDELFTSVLNEDKTRYFIPTKGSCKFVNDDPHDYTRMQFLYLSEEKPNIKNQKSEAKIVEFKVATEGENKFLGLINEDTHLTVYDSKDMDLTTYKDQITLPEFVSPIDGKNTICAFDNGKKLYASLGTGGLYYQHYPHYGPNELMTGVMTFNKRPVNCVYAEAPSGEYFHGGYVYVANGARLTILDRATMEEVASYTLSAKDKIDENEASANYISVEVGEPYPLTHYGIEGSVKERIITVAYGQAGVRIFRFIPTPSSAYPAP